MSDANTDGLLGRLAVHYKLITLDQLSEVTKLQARAGSGEQLGQLLLARGFIKPQQLEQLIKVQRDYLAKQAAKAAPASVPSPAPAASTQGPVAGAAAAAVAQMAAQKAAAKAVEPPAAVDDDKSWLEDNATPNSRPAAAAAPVTPRAPTTAPTPPPSAGTVPVSAAAPTTVATPAVTAAPVPSTVRVVPPVGSSAIQNLLTRAVNEGASDIHVHAGAPIRFRVHGVMRDAEQELLSRERSETLTHSLLTDDQRAILHEKGQVDFAYSLDGVARFRGNAYRQQRGTDCVLRAISAKPKTLTELGLPASLAKFTNFHQGMVLITGPAGCGKSSTLAALVNIINEERRDHIITVEDPIEYVHTPKRCSVNQRQVGAHTTSFARALRAALREDPDIIALGELRDLETISLALTAAETGHLVLATLHTNNAIRTVNRLLGVFPPEQQSQIRTMVSESLRAVVSQRLIPRADGKGRTPVLEILVVNKAVGNLIRENKTFQIRSAMQTGVSQGMVLLDDALRELVTKGVISREDAMKNAEEPAKLKG